MNTESTSHPRSDHLKYFAVYLPQFHPIPENNDWWGPGFTEWTNVTKSKPLFRGHYQPRIPRDLGFYDLRYHPTMIKQAELARSYGIDGFLFYHYWFNGKQLIEKPVNQWRDSGKPDFPFALFWANETWSRRWIGDDSKILIEQTYSEADDHRHCAYLVHMFKDERYIRIDNRPVFIIYRPQHHEDIGRFIRILRQACTDAGLPPAYVIGSNSHSRWKDLMPLGLDCNLDFQPKIGRLPDQEKDGWHWRRFFRNIYRRFGLHPYKVYDEVRIRPLLEGKLFKPHHIPSLIVSWDNSPRRGKEGIVIHNSSPENYGNSLDRITRREITTPGSHHIVVINAWNEWAEGNYLEPDQKWGHAYLQKTLEIKKKYTNG
ncbi:MAG: glycoside hydrolase family 99-like domain-containing protein [Bacteroidetes bacterium]|nr:glycoside hydrolase family 99-like domain-containing protein [Bacteroidota bacterium]